MRVIAGTLGGRTFASPHGHRTHPMSEKARGALFGALGDISGLTVLDPFAGSGALSIEALSRGAASAVAIDADKSAHRAMTENIEALGLGDQMEAVKAFSGSWSTRHQNDKFDLVLLDPPYDDVPYRDVEQRLPRHLADNGTLVLSWAGRARLPIFAGLKIVLQKDYGDAQLVFYQKIR